MEVEIHEVTLTSQQESFFHLLIGLHFKWAEKYIYVTDYKKRGDVFVFFF